MLFLDVKYQKKFSLKIYFVKIARISWQENDILQIDSFLIHFVNIANKEPVF